MLRHSAASIISKANWILAKRSRQSQQKQREKAVNRDLRCAVRLPTGSPLQKTPPLPFPLGSPRRSAQNPPIHANARLFDAPPGLHACPAAATRQHFCRCAATRVATAERLFTKTYANETGEVSCQPMTVRDRAKAATRATRAPWPRHTARGDPARAATVKPPHGPDTNHRRNMRHVDRPACSVSAGGPARSGPIGTAAGFVPDEPPRNVSFASAVLPRHSIG